MLVMAQRALGQHIYDPFSKTASCKVNKYQIKGVALGLGENGTAILGCWVSETTT